MGIKWIGEFDSDMRIVLMDANGVAFSVRESADRQGVAILCPPVAGGVVLDRATVAELLPFLTTYVETGRLESVGEGTSNE